MPPAAARPARTSAKRRAVAVAISLIANGLLLTGFVWELRVTLNRAETGPIELSLAPVESRRTPTSAAAAHRRVLPNLQSRTTPTVAETPPPIAPPSPPTNEPNTDLAALSHAVRTRLGCDFASAARLTDAEQQGCAMRLAAYQRSAREFQLDADKRLAFDEGAKHANWFQQPFLASDPKDGCKLKVNQNEIGAKQGPEWRAGVACGIAF